MNSVKVLVEGYAKISDKGWIAGSSTTYIQTDNGIKIIVDPGANRELLAKSLEQENLTFDEIDFVFLTHYHLDHSLNSSLFSNAKVINDEGIYNQDSAELLSDKIPGTEIEIIKTPGHVDGHLSLMTHTSEGAVLVAGDVFWWDDGEEQIIDIEKADEFATDMKALKLSRRRVLDLADFVIPGHGRKFRVNTDAKLK